MTQRLRNHLKYSITYLAKQYKSYWRSGIWHKFVIILTLIITVASLFMYSVAEWYITSQSSKPLKLGVSFVPDYATSLGLNPQQTMSALINIGVKQFRLTSYWSDGEPTKGIYNFSQLDWEFQMAQQAHAKITLTLGLRQPRWPECHQPSWSVNEPTNIWENQLYNYMKAVINRYKTSPSLANYQLENEYFLKGFGNCTNYSRSRLINEYNLIKKLDPNHPIIVGRSNNALGIPLGQPQPDIFSISIYRKVWDAGVTHRYLEYPFPSWYFAFLAGIQKIFLHKNMVIDEMQAEAWPPHGQTIPETSLKEQNKSMNANDLLANFNYAKATGMKSIDMWGAEYWYYRLVKFHDPSLWNIAKQEYK